MYHFTLFFLYEQGKQDKEKYNSLAQLWEMGL